MTDPLRTIIDRELQTKIVRLAFGSQLDVLRDMVNYGSNLCVRC
jgi:hypothetical protein